MLYLNLDATEVVKLGDSMRPALERATREAAQSLAMATHAKIVENVQKQLHSTRQKYLDKLSFKQVNADTWLINLDKSALWIEDGMEEREMLDDLLKSKSAKTSADGSKYVVVPFQHNKGKTEQTPKATSLTDILKSSMKAMNIPYGKLEKDAQGRPKTGLLHSFDVLKKPASMGGGDVEKGKHSGISLLSGVRVYQQKVKDSTGKESVKRSIMTFRTASSKMRGTGRWHHPGLKPRHFFEEAHKWAESTWKTKILPDILTRFANDL